MNRLIKIILIALLLTTYSNGKLFSCGIDPYWLITDMLFFDPKLLDNPIHMRYEVFTHNFSRYSSDWGCCKDYFVYKPERIPITIYKKNLKIWQKKLKNRFSIPELYNMIYKENITTMLKPQGFKYYKKLPKNFAIIRNHYPRFFRYLVMAKEIENIISYTSPWDFDNSKYYLKKLQKRLLDSISKIKDSFWLSRYAYQSFIVSFYLGDTTKAVKIYKKFLQNTKDTLLKNWAQVYLARIKLRKGDYLQAYKMLFDVFLKVPSKQNGILYLVNTHIADSLYKKNLFNAEQIYFYKLIRNIKYPNFNDLVELIKKDPNNTPVQYVLLSVLNNLKKDYLFYYVLKWNKDTLEKPKNLFYQLKKLSQTIEKGKFENKKFQYLLLSALFNLIKNPSKSIYYNKKAKPLLKTARDSFQYYVNEAVAHLVKLSLQNKYQPYLTDKIQRLILKIDKFVDSEKISLKKIIYEYSFCEDKNIKLLRNYVYMMLAKYFYEKGDLSRFAMIFTKKYHWASFRKPKYVFDYYNDPSSAKKLIPIIQNPKGYLEKSILDSEIRDTLLFETYEFLGTYYLRNDMFEKAIKYFSKVPKQFRLAIYTHNHNPFNNNYDPADTVPQFNEKYTDKLLFAKAMLNKLNSLKNLHSDQKAEVLRQIGNVYLSTSHRGRNWGLVAYGWSIYGLYFGSYYNNNVNENYLTLKKAIHYYQLALKEAKSKKLKAQIYYELAVAYNLRYMIECDMKNLSWWQSCPKPPIIKQFLQKVKLQDKQLAELYSRTCPDVNL